jgi:hypothetical protein
MKIAFVSEMNFIGKINSDYENMRTEFAWICALGAEHYSLSSLSSVKNYDHVFIIFPKGQLNLNVVGVKLSDSYNPTTGLLRTDWITQLKQFNKKVYFVQEGPHWIYNDLEIEDQVNFYNMLVSVDAIFAHNEIDSAYYKGLVHGKPVHILPTLMIEKLVSTLKPSKEDKVIIGGNMSRWYGGFESYVIAREFNLPIWCQTSHAKREIEEQLVSHLPRVSWVDWMKQLSSFKYAVHLMPTVAAGTFSLNCAYLGIPCIGNRDVDTQKLCHSSLSVDVFDLSTARELALELKNNKSFYEDCSYSAKRNYNAYYSINEWKNKLTAILNGANS